MKKSPRTAIVHYSAPPTIGGVEAVISAHARVFIENGYPIKIVAGRGNQSALPEGTEFIKIPSLDSQHKEVLKVNNDLVKGIVSKSYKTLRDKIKIQLTKALKDIDNVIVHNVFSKNFNLALTQALILLHNEGKIPNLIAWCHDFSVKSENDRPNMHEGLPWDILRTYYDDIKYVVVSRKRQEILAGILGIEKEKIEVIYNGFDPNELLRLSSETQKLIRYLSLDNADLIILMPVRITKAKNIEFALQVAAELQSSGRDFKIIITGPPDPHDPDNMAYFEELKEMRKALGLEKVFQFLFEENPESDGPYILDMNVVADLYRVSDMVFMPSHREGFGMPVLEAGFVGKPVFSTKIPASVEIGGEEIHTVSLSRGPDYVAQQIIDWASTDPSHIFRVRTRQNHTWQKIFTNQIQPLLIDN
jgi:glycosyltransferase involved in cell wall biosynthesis